MQVMRDKQLNVPVRMGVSYATMSHFLAGTTMMVTTAAKELRRCRTSSTRCTWSRSTPEQLGQVHDKHRPGAEAAQS